MNVISNQASTVAENKENEFVKQQQSLERHDEFQYLEQIRHIIKNGTTKGDRTGVGTRSVFGGYARYNLRNSKNTNKNWKKKFKAFKRSCNA